MAWNKTFLIALLFPTAAIAQLSRTPLETVESAEAIDWRYVYKEALEEAKAQNKPLLIDFHADWCGPCKMMDAQVFSDPRVVSAVEDFFVAVKVDVDQDERTAFAYHIRSIPRTVVLNVFDEMVGDRVGFMDSDAYLSFLSDVKEYTHTKVDGIVISVPDAPQGPSDRADEISDDTESDELTALMSDRDPNVRAAARKELLTRSREEVEHFLQAGLRSDYLGMRLAAWETLTEMLGQPPDFDPWASKDVRSAKLGEEFRLER